MTDATVAPEELTPQQAVMMIAAVELAQKGALSPDTVELIVMFSPRLTEVQTADPDADTATVTISTWFSGKVFNGRWVLSNLSTTRAVDTKLADMAMDGQFKIAQTVKNYLKELAVKADMMRPGKGSSLITLN